MDDDENARNTRIRDEVRKRFMAKWLNINQSDAPKLRTFCSEGATLDHCVHEAERGAEDWLRRTAEHHKIEHVVTALGHTGTQYTFTLTFVYTAKTPA